MAFFFLDIRFSVESALAEQIFEDRSLAKQKAWQWKARPNNHRKKCCDL
jgi:hypothetical protein